MVKKPSHATVPFTSTLTDFNTKFFFASLEHTVFILRSTDCNLNFVNGSESQRESIPPQTVETKSLANCQRKHFNYYSHTLCM